MLSRRFLGIAIVLGTACGPGGLSTDGGEEEEELTDIPDAGFPEPYCEWESTPLEADEVSPLGFSSTDILEHAAGEHTSTLEWQDTHPQFPDEVAFEVDGAASKFTGLVVEIDLADGAGPRFVDGTAVDPAGLGIVCSDYVAIDAVVSVATMDGVLSELFDAELFRIEDDPVSGDEMPAQVVFELGEPAVEITISKPEGGQLSPETRFLFSFTPQGFSGQVAATISDATGQEFYATTLGTW